MSSDCLRAGWSFFPGRRSQTGRLRKGAWTWCTWNKSGKRPGRRHVCVFQIRVVVHWWWNGWVGGLMDRWMDCDWNWYIRRACSDRKQLNFPSHLSNVCLPPTSNLNLFGIFGRPDVYTTQFDHLALALHAAWFTLLHLFLCVFFSFFFNSLFI